MSETASECLELGDTDARAASTAAGVVNFAAATVRRISAAEVSRKFYCLRGFPIPNGKGSSRDVMRSAKACVDFEYPGHADPHACDRKAGIRLRRRSDGALGMTKPVKPCNREALLVFDRRWVDAALDATDEMMMSVTSSETLHKSGDRLCIHIDSVVNGHVSCAFPTTSTSKALPRTMRDGRVVESTVPRA